MPGRLSGTDPLPSFRERRLARPTGVEALQTIQNMALPLSADAIGGEAF
jgi:hypothetical protein